MKTFAPGRTDVRLIGLVGALALALPGAGCVSRSDHDALLAQHEATEKTLAAKEQELHDIKTEKERLAQDLEKTRATYDSLVGQLETEVANGQVFVEQARDGIRVRLTNDVLFDSGSATVDEEGQEVLSRVSEELASGDYRIEVQGYTDATPIGGRLANRYPSNWELAAARSSEVVRLLQENGVAADRLQAVSFGETRALAANDTPEGRASNRRIEIRLIPTEELIEDLPAVASPPPDV
jgi:chemotaxis protein MotB